MPSNYQRLSAIASKESRYILGLMSGTSMDGLDVALCRVTGQGVETGLELLEFDTIPHPAEYQDKVRAVFTREDATTLQLTILHQYVAEIHAHQTLEALKKWKCKNSEIDLLASHGQTVYHNPEARPFSKSPQRAVTLQLGDGDFLAHMTNIITVSDFRQKHIAVGGEGAPLALYGDFLLCSATDEPRILLNIGGIANFTWLPPAGSGESPVCTDTGPGNTLIDAYMMQYHGQPYDKDGRMGRSGQANVNLLLALLDDPFFDRPLPRTTGPELFNLDYLRQKMDISGTSNLNDPDILSTLYSFTTFSIITAMKKVLTTGVPIYVSGGGMHNPLLMQQLRLLLPGHSIEDASTLGIHPDAKEAIIFAVLANECLFGQPGDYPFTSPSYPRTTLGKVSFP